MEKELEKIESETQEFAGFAESYTIKTGQDADGAGLILKRIADHVKAIKAFFEPRKARAKAAWQDWVDAEKKALEGPQSADKTIRAKVLAWNQKQAEKAEKAQAKALEKAEAKGLDPALVEAPVVQKVQNISIREEWYIKVVDFSKLPDEFKMPDDSKLGKFVRAMKEKTAIPGTEIWSEEKTVVR
jgi:hypothetical protein